MLLKDRLTDEGILLPIELLSQLKMNIFCLKVIADIWKGQKQQQKERTCCTQIVTIYSMPYIRYHTLCNILCNIYFNKCSGHNDKKEQGTFTILNWLQTSDKKGQQQENWTRCTQIIAIYSKRHNIFHILLCNIFYVIYLNLCIAQIDKKEHLIF